VALLVPRRIVLISMPFNIGVGGYKRSYFVLPHLSRELHSKGFEIELYIPANAIRTALKFFMQETCRGKTVDYADCLEEALHRVLETLQNLERESHYALHINEKVLGKILSLNTKLLASKQTSIRREASIGQYIIERNREALMPIFERIAWDQVRQYCVHSSTEELIIYSHHETVDALSVMGFLSRYAKGVILLMQLDVKSFIAKSILHNIRSKLLGVLAVSPQPIIESPFIASITRNLRILIPALALDPVLYTIDKSKSQMERYSAVYFGRLSREKGLVDLLRAWSIISRREPRARLTLIGMPENHETLAIISKYITEHRNVEYLGYLPPEKLYREVVKHHVLIYPSYRDSFSLTVLEALALGLGVVAYDIPVIRYMYSRSSMVYVVKKGDIISLAEGAINWFNRNIEHDKYTKTLIKLHSSWEKVAKAEAQAILLLSRP
jgi:glycosyltransferase involved in cell wall biosynthesis